MIKRIILIGNRRNFNTLISMLVPILEVFCEIIYPRYFSDKNCLFGLSLESLLFVEIDFIVNAGEPFFDFRAIRYILTWNRCDTSTILSICRDPKTG